MEKFFKRLSSSHAQESGSGSGSNEFALGQSSSKQSRLDLSALPSDPGLRKKIVDFHPNDQDEIRRVYLQKGPCQPRNHNFPQRDIGGKLRRFNPEWFDKYGYWLEYSIEKDAAFCLCCYLFKLDMGKQGGGDSFVTDGFIAWNKRDRLDIHVGGCNSFHNQAVKKCENLMNQSQSIQTAINKQTEQAKIEYRARLNASIDCIRFLLRQGLAFRGHNESNNSRNRGNFLELLQFLADHNDNLNSIVLQNAPGNSQMVAPSIQKEIVHATAIMITKNIIEDLGDDWFGILVDESRDVSCKEQMAVVLRYVNKMGDVIERFLGLVHVTDTSALSLKAAIDSLLCEHGLSLSRVRGQGYDGASNMQGEFNGLKSLILRENESAYYVHCFAHQLQLTLVAVAKNHFDVGWLFSLITHVLNVVGASCKRQDMIRERQIVKIIEAMDDNELQTGKGLNQVLGLKRPSETRWGSYYGTLLNMIVLFSTVVDVLEFIEIEGVHSEQRIEAGVLLNSLQTFEFVFTLHLMKKILGVTNTLSLALQRKDQDIINAMSHVKVTKNRMQYMRDEEWESLLNDVTAFCSGHDILIPNMNDLFVPNGRSRRKAPKISNLHHYRAELFYTVIDMQLQELNNRFSEINSDLLLCVACLNPSNSFEVFDQRKLVELAQFYPQDFTDVDVLALVDQLEVYIFDMRSDKRFHELNGLADLSRKLVELKKHIMYPLVYRLLKLALILPVATATVERAFSAMKLIKSKLRNKMCDQWMNDCLVAYIERDVLENITNDVIMYHFQNMKSRRGQL